MCWSCGCCLPGESHGDSRNITTEDLWSAGDAVGITVPQVIHNMKATLKGAAPFGADDTPPYWTGLTKEADETVVAARVVKASEEHRYTLSVAYPANRPDVSVAKDGFRDFVSADVLEKTAWNYMTKYRDVNLFHSEKEGGGQVVESYIYRGPDWHIPSPVDGKDYVVKSGDWMLGYVWDEEGWALVKSGLINGWSPEGGAQRDLKPSADKLAALRKE